MKYDRLTLILMALVLTLIICLGMLLGLDAAGRPWDQDHPVRWFFRDFGAIVGATVAAAAAFFTIQTMREQAQQTIETERQRTAAEQAVNLRSQIDVVRSTWNSFRINAKGALVAYRLAQENIQRRGDEPDPEDQAKEFYKAYESLDPVPVLPQLNMGQMSPGMRSNITHVQTVFNHAINSLNSARRTYIALNARQEEWLRQWERCEIALLGSILFIETVARRTVDEEPFDGVLVEGETAELVTRLGLGRTMPGILRECGLTPSTDFPIVLLMIPETEF